METINKREAWYKGKLVGQKPLLKPKDIWAIRIYLQNAHAVRDLAMFNLAIVSKLGGLRSHQPACARHQAHEESEGRSVATWSFQTGLCPVPDYVPQSLHTQETLPVNAFCGT